jgi:hypothetical protein
MQKSFPRPQAYANQSAEKYGDEKFGSSSSEQFLSRFIMIETFDVVVAMAVERIAHQRVLV